jgi:hypothetical protein
MKLVTLALLIVALGASPALADGTATPADSMDGWLQGTDPSRGTAASDFVSDMTGFWQGSNTAAGNANRALQMMQQWNQMYQALSDLDSELRSRMQDDHSGPEVPSSCGGGAGTQMAAVNHEQTCSECFDRAYHEVTFTRNTLERLRTIYARTIAYIKRAEGFGDSASGIHGLSGLSWQYAKSNIEQEKANLFRTSREKYDGLVNNMRHALDMVGDCERDHFHNPDWYNRYGFIYFEFVRDAYAIHEE